MRIFGKEFRINGFRIYHEGDKPAPSEIGAAASSHSHSNYLPASGGSVTGNINMSENKMLLWNNKGRIYMKSNQQMYLAASSEGTYYLHLGVHDGVWTLDPDTNGVLTLGTANHRWGQIYSSVASIKTSDRNQKEERRSAGREICGSLQEAAAGILPVYRRDFRPDAYRIYCAGCGRSDE